MLKIGFDAKRLFNNRTGLGNYSRTLVKGLQQSFPENKYFLFTPQIGDAEDQAYFMGKAFIPVKAAAGRGGLWRSFLIKSDIQRNDIDIYHGLSNELPFGLGGPRPLKIVTIHDLIFHFYKEDYPWIDRAVYETKFRYACKHADRVIAVSESTKRDIVRLYHVPESKISVVYQAFDERFTKRIPAAEIQNVVRQYGLPSKYLLYVGTINRRKNLLTLVRALKVLVGSVDLPLVVVGNGKRYLGEVRAEIERLGMQERVAFAPGVTPEDLPAMYQGAAMLVYPSRYEGFGLPIVEALASRLPVVTGRVSSLPEAAGPGAHYADTDKPESIAEAIAAIALSPDHAKKLVEDGFRHIQRFTSGTCSEKLMSVYQEMAKNANNP